MNNDGVQKPYTGGIRNRRQRALARAEAQLKSGMKPIHSEKVRELIPLSDSDKKRLEKEISTLKSRV